MSMWLLRSIVRKTSSFRHAQAGRKSLMRNKDIMFVRYLSRRPSAYIYCILKRFDWLTHFPIEFELTTNQRALFEEPQGGKS